MAEDNPDEQQPPKPPFPRAEMLSFVVGLVVATPLAKAGGDAMMAGDYVKGTLAVAGATIAAAGAFSFRYWESHLEEPTRRIIREIAANKTLVAALLLILVGYVVVVFPHLSQKLARLSNGDETIKPTPPPQPLPQSQPPQPAPASADRSFTVRPIGELLTLFEGRTQFQAEKLIEPYKGKWLKAQGRMRQIQANGPPGSTTVMFISNGRMIYCNTGAEWADRLRQLNPDDQISMQGKIALYQNGSILFLEDCELLP